MNQTDFLARFNTGGWDHTLAAGFEFSQERRDFLRNNWGGQVPVNFFDPNATSQAAAAERHRRDRAR